MVKTREKKVVHSGVTPEQMNIAFADYAKADARTQKISAEMDLAVTKIREKYQDELQKLGEVRDEAFAIMQTYGLENQEELFSKKKSMETPHGIIGFRTGTPKLKNLKGFTWSAVTNLLKEFLPDYIRTVEEPAKDKLLAERDNPEVADLFQKVGISVIQDETFFVEPKKEE